MGQRLKNTVKKDTMMTKKKDRENGRPSTSEMSKWKSSVFPGSSLDELLNMRVKAISGELVDSVL